LVVLTSDESAGYRIKGEPIPEMLSQNWGTMALIGAGLQPDSIDDIYGLVDTPLSILDALNLIDDTTSFVGRSMLRNYEDERHLFFANTNIDIVGYLSPQSRLVLCRQDIRDCWSYNRPPTGFIDVEPAPTPVSLEERVTLRRVARISDEELIRKREREDQVIHSLLLKDTQLRGVKERFANYAASGQKIGVEQGTSMELTLDIVVCGLERRDSVILKGDFISEEKLGQHLEIFAAIETRPLKVGDRFVYKYQTTATRRHRQVEFWFYSDLSPGEGATLIVNTAQLTLTEDNKLPLEQSGAYVEFDCSSIVTH